MPLLWTFMFFLKNKFPDLYISNFFSHNLIFAFGIVSVLRLFSSDDRYMSDILIDNEKIILTYLTSFAIERKISISIEKIVNTKIKHKIFFIRDFTTVTFYSKTNKIDFNIMTDELKQRIIKLNKISFEDLPKKQVDTCKIIKDV